MLPLPTLPRWGIILVQHITSCCLVPSWELYRLSRPCDPIIDLWYWTHLPLFAQGSGQAHLGLLHIHLLRLRRCTFRSRWFGSLDDRHQKGAGHQYLDDQCSICPSPSWDRSVRWHWAIPRVGGVCLPGDERYSLCD